jgi:hypothetical protein
MSFPSNPVTGQTTVTNNITYVYNSAGTGYWTRVYANTSTLAATVAALNIANTSDSTSTTTGALVVGGGVGIAGNINFGGELYQNGKLFTTSGTGTTTTFLISNITESTSTNTGALVVNGGVGIGRSLYIGARAYIGAGSATGTRTLNVSGTIGSTQAMYALQFADVADNNYYIWPSRTSQVNAVAAQGTELAPGSTNATGLISVTRGQSTNTSYSYYGLYNQFASVGVGLDNSNNLWFGGVTAGSNTAVRSSTYFYSDGFGNVFASGSFRANTFYAFNSSSYYLNLVTSTASNHVILSSAASSDLIGYDITNGYYFGGLGKYIATGSSGYSGPVWVSTGTAYTIVHSGNIGQYAGGGAATTFTSPVTIKYNNSGVTSATGHLILINNTGSNSGIYWSFGNNPTTRASIRANTFGDFSFNSLSGNYYYQQDFGSSSTIFQNSTTQFMIVDGAGNIGHPGTVSGSRFIDSNNPATFVDPSGVSVVTALTVNGAFTATYSSGVTSRTSINQTIQASPATGAAYIVANRASLAAGEVGFGWGTGVAGATPVWTNFNATNSNVLAWSYNSVPQLFLTNANVLQTTPSGSMQASAFFDVTNTAFVLRPGSFSYLNAVQVTGGTTGITTGTGVRVFQPGSNTVTSTLYWGNGNNTQAWNWQQNTIGNAALWSITPPNNTWTQVLLVSPTGSLNINQKAPPGDIVMFGGLSANGTGTTQLSLQRNGVSGMSVRVSDIYAGDFSLYDNAQGSWNRAINAQRGFVGINTGSTSTITLNVGGGVFSYGIMYANSFASARDGSKFFDPAGTSVLTNVSANSYSWQGTTSTGYGISQHNTFETAAVIGGDRILGSGTTLDLFAFNPPATLQILIGASYQSFPVNANIFSGKNSMNFVANVTLTRLNNIVVFTWPTFGIRSWDSLVISGNTNGIPLFATFESSPNGVNWTVHAQNLPMGTTFPTGYNYLRYNGANTGVQFRLTITASSPFNFTVNIANISLYGISGQAQRLLDWDGNRNITTVGNIYSGIFYDRQNTAFFLNPEGTSTLYSSTFTNDLSVGGQGRFGGWFNGVGGGAQAGMSVEVGTSGLDGIVQSYNRRTASYFPLKLYGSPISLIPGPNRGVFVAGILYDGDNSNFYLKPSTSSNIFGLTTLGPVTMVNQLGTDYNENIRLPRAADGYSTIAMAVSGSSAIGNVAGQFNISVYPSAIGGNFAIRNQAANVMTIFPGTTALLSTATFSTDVYANRFLTTNGVGTYWLQPTGDSYLNRLNVDNRPVLTRGPNDDYANTFTYVHASIGNGGVSNIFDFNDTTRLPFQSIVGSINAVSNTPFGTALYSLYQAQHRGGNNVAPAGDGPNYSSQISIGLNNANYASRMAFRVKNNGAWTSWYEPVVSGQNPATRYNIYAQRYYSSDDSQYFLQPQGTSNIASINVVGNITGALSGTPVVTAPFYGSAEWIKPYITSNGITGTGVRAAYRQGLYNYKIVNDSSSPTGNPGYYAGVGFGQGTGGSAEIAINWIPVGPSSNQASGAYFRTLRDGVTGWTTWTRLLNNVDDIYAGSMNQYVRTTDSPSFVNITLTGTAPVAYNNIRVNSISGNNQITNASTMNMTWNGSGYGGFGTFGNGANATSFRFDGVASRDVQQSYSGFGNIGIYLGGNKIFSDSGATLYTTTIYDLANSSWYLVPALTSQVNNMRASSFELNGNSSNPAIFYTTQARTRGFTDPSWLNPGYVLYGNLALTGTGLNGWKAMSADSLHFGGYGSQGGVFDSWGGGHWLIFSTLGLNPATAYMGINGNTVSSSFNVYVTGSIYATANIFAYSDRRKKRDITTIDNALSKVLQLRGVYYYRIDAATDSDIDRRDLGVIAQEVQEVVPEAVKYADDVDEYSVNYGNLAGLFIEAIKDLKKELDEVKSELNILKGNN